MTMRHSLLTGATLALGSILLFTAPSRAGDALPKSGSLKFLTAVKLDNHGVKVGENHFVGSGNGAGVNFNVAGSGPLHMGTALCSLSFDYKDGSFVDGGFCADTDSDGDQMFTTWAGKGGDKVDESGTETITGGTGKFAGITGGGSYTAKMLNQSQGIVAATHELNYKLPGAN